MLKEELIKAVAVEAGASHASVRGVFDALTRVVKSRIAVGESVMLAGLGKLVLRHRGARIARHMVSGEPMHVPARWTVALKPSDSLSAAAASLVNRAA